MTKVEKLPKASLMTVHWSWTCFYFARFRLANAIQFQVGWLTLIFRAPWLERSARALYPHLFEDRP